MKCTKQNKMKDVYQVRDEPQENEILTINYTKPKFWHRLMANFVDIFIMFVLFLSLFIGVRAIVQATPSYKNDQKRLNDIQLECGLYVENPSNDVTGNYDIIYYCDNYVGTYGKDFDPDITSSPSGKIGRVVKAIKIFLAFSSENSSQERYQELVGYYDSYRLDTTLDGVHYFIKDGDSIVPNATLAEDSTKLVYFYNNVYKPFIEKRCIPFLTSNVPEYNKLMRMDVRYLLFIEVPIAYCLAGILTYMVPPLFFKRGRKTLGKALYHIGLIDKRVLSPTLPRFFARFSIFFFGELILSLFSFGIPYIISFTMMLVTKNKQGFPDYMLGLYEIDTSKANIYMDYVEAQLKNTLHGQAIDFKMEKPL